MLDHPSPEVDNGDHEPHLGGRLIRPYSVTKGRTRPCFDIPIETLVRSTGRAAAPTLGAEERSILALLGGPISLAQIAARRGLGLGVVRVLVADLVVSGMVETVESRAARSGRQAEAPSGSMTPPPPVTVPVKIVVAGGLGVGKTTFINSVSETEPRTAEAATDVGRVTLGDDLIGHLFGAPQQERLLSGWDDLICGALGAVVLVDTGRLSDSFLVIDSFERSGLPFVVAVNCFYANAYHSLVEVREALTVAAGVPIFYTDARRNGATRNSLLQLVQYARSRAAS